MSQAFRTAIYLSPPVFLDSGPDAVSAPWKLQLPGEKERRGKEKEREKGRKRGREKERKRKRNGRKGGREGGRKKVAEPDAH